MYTSDLHSREPILNQGVAADTKLKNDVHNHGSDSFKETGPLFLLVYHSQLNTWELQF